MKIPTPLYSHVYKYDDVYEPAEDTFLFLDALEDQADKIQSIDPKIVLEIGSGSGIVSTFIAKIIGSLASYFCTDKNPSASVCTRETGKINSVQLLTVTTNFVEGLLPRLKNNVDVLLFNPPYVVTPTKEIADGGIAFAWAGGTNGREVMDQFFPLIPELLSPKGLFFLVVIEENNPQDIIKTLDGLGLKGEIIKTRKAGLEVLSILKFSRS
uniref:methyltransferase N6AMT1-like n=1 Tax=Styela clava TaxID=7725 RepID=UPI00193A68C8|nr:methyltransferase N6AMT1-like [Styela clava]